ncbi:MAG: hypothetical protein LBT33_02515 [Spirochaetia bacterium]|jgi:uncharacterized protein YPO0396|nr:hypothetical protein [Spirochaetia bacterium]
MITLERARLVGWHFFEDSTIDIGNRCLLAGDNGSGKSTIVDAIQYAMAADLRKAKFNAAAGDRKGGGRDLTGYVRCKLGSEATEYLRDDAVAHVMLEFSCPGEAFTAGVCVEAFSDGRLTEHFWLGQNIPVSRLQVRGEGGDPLVFRQFRDLLAGSGARVYDSKKQYLRDFTARLGVWRRMAEYNPYLEAFTRSVSFTPLVSVDRFVCDYILEDRPVDISTMKANLESYKEADREARAAVLRIEALKKICAKAAEWQNYQGLIIKQEYLKLRLERDREALGEKALEQKLRDGEARQASLEREIESLGAARFEWEHERQETERALAVHDAHILYTRLEEKTGRLRLELEGERKKAERHGILKSQCEALLDRPLAGNPADDIPLVEAEETQSRGEKDEARRQKNEAAQALHEALAELAELEKGLPRYPEAPTALREALQKDGISAHFLADTAEVTDPEWTDAVEGWLNTLRFAVLVDPGEFQKALEIYDSLPRSVGGAFLPNLEKMRQAQSREGSLARLVKTDSPYARIYVDYILGEVMRADIRSLKTYARAVTRECMAYSNHTASRIREEVYRRRYLGMAARKERKDFLSAEAFRLRRERDEAAEKERRAAEREELSRRAYRALLEIAQLLPSLAACQRLQSEIAEAETALAAIDTKGFQELQNKRNELSLRIREAGERLMALNKALGQTEEVLAESRSGLSAAAQALETCEASLAAFSESHPREMGGCEAYAEEKIRKTGIQELIGSYESTLKTFTTRTETLQREYHNLVQAYDRDFNALLSVEPSESAEADKILMRLETSELPAYREKIAKTRRDAEREFKDHFIAILNEKIENARESFREINDTLKTLSFGRDQYRFTLEERSDRRGQIEIIKKAAAIPALEEDGLFSQLTDPAEHKAAQELFERILAANPDSPELRTICDYRSYFHYDIKIRDTQSIDHNTGKPLELSLSKVLREKSGGEAQTPYYVAIAASFYRFYKTRPEETVRLVMFDEAFNRMDDERIGSILEFYRNLDIQIISSVPTEKIEAIAPHMDRINLVIRHGYNAFVRDFHKKSADHT